MGMIMKRSKEWVVLLIDDDRADADMVRIGIKRKAIPFRLYHVERGADAIDFLNKRGDYAHVPSPDFILLDLKMPLMSGFEVLEHVKSVEAFQHIPVIVWTGSESTRDIVRSYKMYANTYITKPEGPVEFFDTLEALANYWLHHAQLPS